MEALLLLAGLACIGVFIWSKVNETVSQHLSSEAFDRQTPQQHSGQPPTQAPPPPIHKNDVVGRLIIPRLHLRDMVREGTGEDTLEVALGHIEGTALPGRAGNVGIAGHRDTMFRALRNIKTNDLIQFQTPAGSFLYRVERTTIVDPQNVEVLRAGEYPELTLVTCYPFYYVGSAPKRFIVKARQVGTSLPSPSDDVASQPVPQRKDVEPQPVPQRRSAGSETATRMVMFQIAKGHSRELAPGISFGVSSASSAGHLVNGWMWLMPDRRTIWLRDQNMREPVVFYSGVDGSRHELRITNVTNEGVNGYLLLYHEHPSRAARALQPRRRNKARSAA
jgi:sortase A